MFLASMCCLVCCNRTQKMNVLSMSKREIYQRYVKFTKVGLLTKFKVNLSLNTESIILHEIHLVYIFQPVSLDLAQSQLVIWINMMKKNLNLVEQHRTHKLMMIQKQSGWSGRIQNHGHCGSKERGETWKQRVPSSSLLFPVVLNSNRRLSTSTINKLTYQKIRSQHDSAQLSTQPIWT